MHLAKTFFRLLFTLLLAISMSGIARADVTKLKISFFFDPNEMTYQTTLKPWIDSVNAEGKGVVELEPYFSGTLGKGPGVQAQTVLDGVADIAFIIPGFSPGRFPELSVLELPGLFRGFRDTTIIINRLVMSGQFQDLKDFHLIWVFGNEPYSVHMRTEVKSLEDLKGKKIRAASAGMAQALKALGAVPVVIPTTEVTEALGRGTVDGALSPTAVFGDYGIDRVTKYDYTLPVAAGGGFVGMSRSRWDALPKPAQDILTKYGNDWLMDRYLSEYGKHVQAMADKYATDPKRSTIKPTDAELTAAKAAYKPIYDSWSARSPRDAELLQLVLDDIRKYEASRK